MSRFAIRPTPIDGLVVVERRPIGDERGSLTRLFCADELAAAGWSEGIAQINLTTTAGRGTVRGLHYQQAPHAETKLVSCLHGEVWDVVVDLRRHSASFLRWHAERLSETNRLALLVPKGCAHGFQTLADNVEMLYLHSAAHAPDAEAGLHPLDPRLAICWPLPVEAMSARDHGHPWIGADAAGVAG
ncbi:MAG: dTDP-4-dehydrorhamnose 3,5-epimerase family protein [Caldimonas sp.]